MKPSPEIDRMLVLCTTHVSRKTAKFLDACEHKDVGMIVYDKNDYGWFVPVLNEDEPSTPTDLSNCLRFARLNGCAWIMFDRDAGPIDDLETFNW